MRKQLLLQLAAIAVAITGLSQSAQAEVTEGTIFTAENGIRYTVKSVGRQTVEVTKPASNYSKYKGDIVIPEYVTYEDVDYKVVGIIAGALKSQDFTSISLPPSITVIKDSEFSSCSKMTSITLPETIDSIFNSAFYSCSALPEINIPASVKYIGDQVFRSCSVLKEFKVAEGNLCFTGKDGMLFNAECDTLRYYAMGLTETELTIPEGVTVIGAYAAYQNKTLKALNIPACVKTIMNNAFDGCSNISTITLSEGLETLGTAVFQQAAITEITLPESLVTIEGNAFSQCKSLTSLIIPDHVTTIGDFGIMNCSVLTDVTLGRNVTNMGKTVFFNDKVIVNVVSLNPVPPVCNGTGQFNSDAVKKATLKVPRGSLEAYKAAVGFETFANYAEFEEAKAMEVPETSLEITAGNTATIKPVMTPAEAYQYAEFTSEDPEVATVDNLGTITAVAKGSTTIKVATMDGSNLTKEIPITVLPDYTGINTVKTENASTISAGEAYEVYTVTGVKVAEGTAPISKDLAKGIYIVKTNSGSVKVKI